MAYTVITLAALGLMGILLHNLIKLNDINRANDGNINILKYWRLERFTIMISFIAIIIALIARSEIKELEQVGKWLGLAFVAIGYMAQSIVVKFMGKAQKYVDDKTKTD